MTMDLLQDIMLFFGGLGMFIYGMQIMAEGLQNSAGSKTRKLLGLLTNNRILGVLVGALITAIIQSSSATTVMVVGFVNAQIMNLTQAVGVIMGANIGTTMTAWIVSMSEWGSLLKPDFFAPILLVVGVGMMLFSKKEKIKDGANILVGFGILFIGLSTMSGAIEPYSDSPIFSQAFTVIGNNPILGLLVGAAVTGIIQSSSASMGILQALAMNGVVNWGSAVFIALGQNIGTCVTAILSCIGANKNAKRAAVIHLLFNCIGALFFGAICWLTFLAIPNLAMSNVTSTELAIFHTCFNVLTTIILFPFANKLVTLSKLIIKDNVEEDNAVDEGEVLVKLDERLLQTPSFALVRVNREIEKMGKLALESIAYTKDALLEKKNIDKIYDREKKINEYEKQLSEFISLMDLSTLNEKEQLQVKHALLAVSDVERIGDHCRNIADMAKDLEEDAFSQSAKDDIEIISNQCYKTLRWALDIRANLDVSKFEKVEKHETKVDKMQDQMREGHIQRLIDKKCQVEAGIIFLDSVSDYERISDHAENLAQYVVEEEEKF